jgi:uncharacterized membrane protein
MLHDRRHYVILPLAALVAVLPLILRGCSCGHDFDFHIINWFEAAKQFTHGTVHPQWAFTAAWNAGEPRFVFYPPLSWTIGAILGLIMPWAWTPIAYTWLALTAAGFTLHYSARSFATPNAALIAAAIYIANPYMMYTAYERTAYAELLAAAWLPLLLHAILSERVTVRAIAIPVALLWLTNAPAAVMGCYALAFTALLRLVLSRRQETFLRVNFLLTTIAGTMLGLGLASFYIIPAAYQQRFVQIAFAILPGLSPQENFLFRHTTDPDHDAVLYTASILAVVLIVLTASVLIAFAIVQHRELTPPSAAKVTELEGEVPGSSLTLCLMLLAAVIVFMLTPLSAPFWNYLPQLRFLQFPWRLLAILAVVFAFAIALVLSRMRLHATVISLIAAATFTVPAYKAFHQRCYPEDTLTERLAIFRSANPGTDPTDEYTPATADNDSLGKGNPGYWLSDTADAAAPASTSPGPAPRDLELIAPAPTILVLNLRDYPSWHVVRNGTAITTRLHRDDGLIAIPLPAGTSRIQLAFETSRDQQIGYLVSSLSLLLLTLLLVLSDRGSRHPPDSPDSEDPGVHSLQSFP